MRFTPDNLTEALLRYVAMAAPDASVYVEIAAPDLRFAAMALLAATALLVWRRLPSRPVRAMLVLVLAATVPWLMTTGNGRYWIAMLLCVGPAVVGLIFVLPLTRAFRLFLAGGLLAAQAFVVWLNPPADTWLLATWDDAPYFHFQLPPSPPGEAPITYVTMSVLSYSLVAHQFPASSRWININTLHATDRDPLLRERFLAQAGRLELMIPSIVGGFAADGQPSAKVRQGLNSLMGHARLMLDEGRSCTFLESRSLGTGGTRKSVLTPEQVAELGFWLCPLQRTEAPVLPDALRLPARTEAAFEWVERMCPRYFSGPSPSMPIRDGVLRTYSSDMKVYVLNSGQVAYKYWRAINLTSIGSVDDVLSGKGTLRCDQLRGRSGLPWQREL